jgi:crotonobetainyl-CoA:carnitine CoA-transferase CaiB-like acyl-CoA transferase
MTDDPAEREAVREELETLFAEKTRDEWEATLGDTEAMVAPVRTPAEALDSEAAAARDLIDHSGTVPRVAFPAQSTAKPDEAAGSPPGHGEHTDAVLEAAGYDAARIDDLREDGVIE